MFGIPWHPLIVHFPIVLSVAFPLAAIAVLIIGLGRSNVRKLWVGVMVVNALLAGSGLLAMQTGEHDEERVENVLVSEGPLETHADNAQVFLYVTGLALLLSALGLSSGYWGGLGRGLGTFASVVVLVLGIRVGHSGGGLVYQHGAAAAFVGDQAVADNANGASRSAGGKKGSEEAMEARKAGATESEGKGESKDADD